MSTPEMIDTLNRIEERLRHLPKMAFTVPTRFPTDTSKDQYVEIAIAYIPELDALMLCAALQHLMADLRLAQIVAPALPTPPLEDE